MWGGGAEASRNMKRVLLILLLFLLLGAVVNVGVAWALQLWGRQPIPDPPNIWGQLWLLIPGPFALRRFLRTRRGLCPRCAYPVGESAVCSECGRELPRGVRVGT